MCYYLKRVSVKILSQPHLSRISSKQLDNRFEHYSMFSSLRLMQQTELAPPSFWGHTWRFSSFSENYSHSKQIVSRTQTNDPVLTLSTVDTCAILYVLFCFFVECRKTQVSAKVFPGTHVIYDVCVAVALKPVTVHWRQARLSFIRQFYNSKSSIMLGS